MKGEARLDGGFDAGGECGDAAIGFGFGDDGVEVLEDFGDAHGVHLAVGVVALFDDLLEVAACDLGGELVGDDHAGALLVLDPGSAGQSDPHGAVVHVEADIDRVGVARCDGHDVRFPLAVEVFFAPAVGDVKILIHGTSVSFRLRAGQAGLRAGRGKCAGPFGDFADESDEGRTDMQVSVDVTDEMSHEAELRGLPVTDYIELRMEKGRAALSGGTAMSSAIERIRALRSAEKGSEPLIPLTRRWTLQFSH